MGAIFRITKIRVLIVAGLAVVIASLWFIPGPDNIGATVRIEFEEEVQQGQERQARVVVDSNTPVNSVDVAIRYQPDLLSVMNVSMDESRFDTQIFEPASDVDNHKVRFVQATLEPFKGEGALVGTIDFKAQKQGTPEFVFENAQVIAHDGNGTNVYYPKLPQSVGEWLVGLVQGKK